MDEKTKMLLDAQEHPEQFTDEALRQMQDDPEIRVLMEATAQGKRALMKQQPKASQEAIDAAWQDFEAKHLPKAVKVSILHKVAASVIGLLFISGIAFAAIHIVRNYRNAVGEDVKSPTQEVRISNPSQPSPALPADTVKTDTTANAKPIVFDNVSLDKMMPQIAAYYNKEVEFQNEDARQFRFYFVWKQDETLDVVLHRLNLFESITVELKSDKIVVE